MKYMLIVALATLSFSLQAQDNMKVNHPINWHMLSFEKDGVYGAEVERTYELLKDRQPKRRVVVAVIDGGCDIAHEDLENKLWVNKKEIAGNGIDDDKNGYIDDVNGWNFLGNKEKSFSNLSNEGDRLFLKLYDKYKNVDTLKLSKTDYTEYQYFKNELLKISPLCNAYFAIDLTRKIVRFADSFDKEMKAKFPNEDLTYEHFKQIMNRDEKNMDRVNAHFYFVMGWSQDKNAPWTEIFELRNQIVTMAQENFNKKMAAITDERNLCGDDMNDPNNKNYGNNILAVGKMSHSTHIAGIIGAERSNDIGIDGVADVELMMLRIGGGTGGDEYDKDVALAIRYAVDNGANIINMSFGKDLSPNKKWVDDAMIYAQKKGVLMINAAGNGSKKIENNVYPTKYTAKGKEIENFICVGSISADGVPAKTSNYSDKEVDLFAPGVEIYSSVENDNYKKMNGTSMAAPVVAGVAALIWNYFPELSAKQVKEVILSSATKIGDEKLVPQPQYPQIMAPPMMVYFRSLCTTGGVLNAYNAVKTAIEITKK